MSARLQRIRRALRIACAAATACALVAVALLPASARADESTPVTANEIQIELDLQQQMNSLWNQMPDSGDSSSVRLLRDTQPDCASAALRLARGSITRADAARGMKQVGKIYFKIGKLVLKGFGLGTVGDAADIALKVLESGSADEFAVKMGEFLVGKGASSLVKSDLVKSLGLPQGLPEQTLASEAAKALYNKLIGQKGEGWEEVVNSPCPDTHVQLWTGTGDAGLGLTMFIWGNCQCKWPERVPEPMRLTYFGVYARRFYTPKVAIEGQAVKVTFDVASTEYFVRARCGCPTRTALADPPRTAGGQTDGLVGQIGDLPGFAVSYDTPAWCTYGGGSTGLPGSTGTPPPGEPPLSGTPPPGEPTTSSGGGDPSLAPPPPGLTAPPPGLFFPEDTPDGGTTTRPPPSKPEDTAPPETLTGVPVKATQTVLEGGVAHTSAVAGARVKLDVGPDPQLPLDGAPVDDGGFADEPLQAVTGSDGTATIPVAQTIPGYTGTPVELDLSPTSSTLVYLKQGADPKRALSPDLHRYMGRAFTVGGVTVVPLFHKGVGPSQIEKSLAKCKDAEGHEPNYCRDEQLDPDDPHFRSTGTWGQRYPDQWAIQRVGLTRGEDSAWNLVGSNPSPILVAVVDTGLDWNHADIDRARLWRNPRETPGNGRDDDGNGYVDDVIGWNFQNQTASPFDRDGHGTFVTGVIAAATDNGVGIAGVNPWARIMVLKALNDFGHTRASFLAEAIAYAADNGARVINVSVGGKNLTRAETLAVQHAHAKGALVVVAAGNDAVNVAEFGPAGVPGALAVASTGLDDQRAPFSNTGEGIALAAPGMDVLSLRARRTDFMRDLPGVKYQAGESFVGADRRYYRTSGTSFSAPIVSGVASLVLSKRPELGADDLREILLQTARDVGVPGQDHHTGHGIVDARAALRAEPGVTLRTEIEGVEVVREGEGQVVVVKGSATADALRRRWIEIGAGDEPKSWKRIGDEHATPVEKGELGRIPAGDLRGSKVWTIRSVIEHENGEKREVRFRLELG